MDAVTLKRWLIGVAIAGVLAIGTTCVVMANQNAGPRSNVEVPQRGM